MIQATTPKLPDNNLKGGGVLLSLIAIALTATLLSIGAMEIMERKTENKKGEDNV